MQLSTSYLSNWIVMMAVARRTTRLAQGASNFSASTHAHGSAYSAKPRM